MNTTLTSILALITAILLVYGIPLLLVAVVVYLLVKLLRK